jgi:hypothetical protein
VSFHVGPEEGKRVVPEKVKKQVYLDDKTYNVVDVKRGGMGRVWLLENALMMHTTPSNKSRLQSKLLILLRSTMQLSKNSTLG